jgi:AhpD family alkylhydroperoxidase
MSHTDQYQELASRIGALGERLPAEMKAFGDLHEAAGTSRALSTGTRELIALAIGIAVHCDGCVTFHIHDALQAGVTREEILDSIGVAVMMGGGPAVVYGSLALEVLDEMAPPEGTPG